MKLTWILKIHGFSFRDKLKMGNVKPNKANRILNFCEVHTMVIPYSLLSSHRQNCSKFWGWHTNYHCIISLQFTSRKALGIKSKIQLSIIKMNLYFSSLGTNSSLKIMCMPSWKRTRRHFWILLCDQFQAFMTAFDSLHYNWKVNILKSIANILPHLILSMNFRNVNLFRWGDSNQKEIIECLTNRIQALMYKCII